MEVDLNLEENKNPTQKLDGSEDIEATWVKLKGLMRNIEELAQENNYDIDQRLYNWALGIEYAEEHGLLQTQNIPEKYTNKI